MRGSRVPKLTSTTWDADASSVRSHAVVAVTVATSVDAGGAVPVSWMAGTHPG